MSYKVDWYGERSYIVVAKCITYFYCAILLLLGYITTLIYAHVHVCTPNLSGVTYSFWCFKLTTIPAFTKAPLPWNFRLKTSYYFFLKIQLENTSFFFMPDVHIHKHEHHMYLVKSSHSNSVYTFMPFSVLTRKVHPFLLTVLSVDVCICLRMKHYTSNM